MVGKIGEEPNDTEVQKLREKFNEIVNTPDSPEPVQEHPAEKFNYVEPEKAEDNERITNLIMQQIKELIEIDNNLNSKVKELEGKISSNASNVSATKNLVEQFNARLEMIEKNMEKFMGLYEVVTNRFNPFVSEDDSEAVIQDAITPSKPNMKIMESEAEDIISISGIDPKLKPEQKKIVKEEIEKGIDLMGPDTAERMKKELSEHLAKTIGEELRKALVHHMKLSNDNLKNTMKEMMLETISHLRASGTSTKNIAEANNEVHPDYHFYLRDGTPIKNVTGLKEALRTMDNATFQSHVDETKNDFAEWIRMVYKRDDIAEEIEKHKDPDGIIKVLDRVS